MKVLCMSCCCVDLFPEKEELQVGGNALNVAVSCARTGKAEVHVMGNIGQDAYGKAIVSKLDKYGISHEKLYALEGESAHHVIHITQEGDRYFTQGSWYNGVYADFGITEKEAEYMQGMDAVITTLYDPAYKQILALKKKSKFLLAVDFHDESVNTKWEADLENIELFFISGRNEELHILKEWSTKYKTVFVATLGKDGSIAYYEGKEYKIPAEKVEEVVDTTGCGDSYIGAFAVNYLQHKDIMQAMKSGSLSAAQTLTYVGGVE